MKKLLTSVALCLVVVLPGETQAQTLDKSGRGRSEEVIRCTGDRRRANASGGICRPTTAKSVVGAQVVARGDKSFHALVLEGGLPGDGLGWWSLRPIGKWSPVGGAGGISFPE